MQCLHFRLKVEQIIPISREKACVVVQTYFEKGQMVCVREILARWFYPGNNNIPSPWDVFMSQQDQEKCLCEETERSVSKSVIACVCVCVCWLSFPREAFMLERRIIEGIWEISQVSLMSVFFFLIIFYDLTRYSFFFFNISVYSCVCNLVVVFQGSLNILDRQPQQQPHQ